MTSTNENCGCCLEVSPNGKLCIAAVVASDDVDLKDCPCKTCLIKCICEEVCDTFQLFMYPSDFINDYDVPW